MRVILLGLFSAFSRRVGAFTNFHYYLLLRPRIYNLEVAEPGFPLSETYTRTCTTAAAGRPDCSGAGEIDEHLSLVYYPQRPSRGIGVSCKSVTKAA